MKPKPNETLVLLTAPRGFATFNIGGTTLHSAFILNSSDNDNISWLKCSTMQTKIEKLVLCMVDEKSMVGSPSLQNINRRICKMWGCDKEWGVICMLAVGDLYQLPSVGPPPVYMHQSNVKGLDDLAPLPWHGFMFHQLIYIIRQKGNAFASMLNEISKKCPKVNSLEDVMLQSHELHIDDNHLIILEMLCMSMQKMNTV